VGGRTEGVALAARGRPSAVTAQSRVQHDSPCRPRTPSQENTAAAGTARAFLARNVRAPDDPIGDEAARAFAVGFYRALGYRCSIGDAVEQAIATMAAKRLPGERLPFCRFREGLTADQLFSPVARR
jgi:hypothetical protein